jgi:uncharacterized membrane protein
MDVVEAPQIYSFGITPKANFEQPSEQLITLTIGQLQGLITQAVENGIQNAVKPLQDRLDALEETLHLEVAYDRQRIAKLEQKEPQPLQKDRGEILRVLIAANGGKMLARDARRKMHLSRSRFSELLSTTIDYIETKPYHLHKNWKVLILK